MNRPLDLPFISVDLSREEEFSIGALQVCPSHRQVSANGQQETVQPRVMQVLVALARAKGAVLSRDSLVETCWDGLSVGDDAINRCVAKVRQLAEFGGGRHFEIETIPRVGYRLKATSAVTEAAQDNSPASSFVAGAATADMAKASSGGPAGPPAGNSFRRAPGYAAIAMLLVGLAAVSFAWFAFHPSPRPSPLNRDPLLAVVPFRNLNADAGSRYFSDGITQEIVDALLQTTEIRVAAPASSFALRDADPARAARVLGATHILSGSVERHGGDLRVVAQLSDIASRRAIWSHIYRTTVAQTPGLQHHIAVQIANALDMRLPSRRANETAQVNPEAYDHYLRGRDLFRQRRDGPVALDELEKSVRLAPRFAKAWSTLAATRYLMASGSAETHGPMLTKARDAAKRALAIDPHNAEALGVLALSFEGNPLLQDRLFEQALRAEPNNTQLLNWHHNFLGAVGRTREAGWDIQRAYELDRLTPAVIWNYAFDLLENGDLAQARQIIDLAAENCSADEAFEARGQYLIAAHDWNGLSRHLQTPAARLQPQLATVFRLAEDTIKARDHGDSSEFPRLRAEWHAIVTDDPAYPVRYLTLLGDTPGALRIIKKSFTSAAPGYFIGVNNAVLLFVPTLPALRRDPGARALMAKLGLFEYWRASDHWPDFCDEPGLPFDCKTEAKKLKS